MSNETIEINIDNNFKLTTGIGSRPGAEIDYRLPYYKINGLDQKTQVYKRLLFLPIKTENHGGATNKEKQISDGFKLSDNILFENLTEPNKEKIDGLLTKNFNDDNINQIEKNKEAGKSSTTINKSTPLSPICKYNDSETEYYFFMIYFETDNKQFTTDQLFTTGINKNFKLYYNFDLQLGGDKIIGIEKKEGTTNIIFKINKKEEIKINKVDPSDYGVYLPIIEVINGGGNEKKMFFVLGKSNYLYDYQNYDPPRIVGKIDDPKTEPPKFSFNEEYSKFFNNK